MPAFIVPDMHCDGCIASMTKAIQAIDPHARVTADLVRHEVDVTSHQPAEALAAAIEDAGFSVQSAA